jgi:Zn-dependent protease
MMDQDTLLTGFLWFVAFLFSTTVHEAMHALAALRGGDPTAYHGGQVSLSPVPHIKREPIGMLVVPLLTALTQGWAIGWASTPYDAHWAARYPKRAALMAAAGPAGNLSIALVAFVLIKIGLAAGWFVAPDSVTFEHLVSSPAGDGRTFAGTLLSIFLTLNVLLAAFNMIPLPPLDGASVLGILLPTNAEVKFRELSRSPMFQLAGLLIAWRVFPMIVGPLFAMILASVHPGLRYG